MSGAQTSTFADPNVLLRTLSGDQTAQVQRNQLLNQGAQQALNENEMEQISRASNWVISQDPDNKDPAKQAAAYGAAVKLLRANNFAKNAPEQYPGFDAMQMMARQGTPSAEQLKLGQAGTAIPTPGFSTGGTTPAAGGSGTAAAAAPGTIEPEAMSRANAVRDGLMKRGLDYDTATAFAANALHESSANPNTGAGDAGASHGLFQWRGDRYDRYVAKYGHSPDNAPLDEQLDYVLDELNGPESLAKGRIAQAQGPEGKAGEVSQAFLRPKDVAAEMARRSATAKQLAALGPAPAAPPGGGVVARNPGAVQVAGPGAGAPAATTAPPAAYATAPTKEAATAQAIATGKPALIEGGQGAAALPNGRLVANLPDLPTATPPPQQTAQPPPQVKMPAAPDEMDGNHLTRQDYVDLDRAKRSGMGGPQLTQEVQQRQNANLIRQRQYQEDVRQAQNDALARQDKATTQAQAAATQQREEASAAALAEQRRIENKRQQEAADRDAQRLAQGSTQADKDTYTLTHNDPSTPEYADAWTRKKWEVAPNGNVVEKDVSQYPAPTRSIQRPSFLPAPTPQGLDEVRKADTDAKVITSAIDHYTDVFAATGGTNWGAYFDNPQSPQAQQLLGAFDRLKTVLRSPVYYNTGVLQPAEMAMLKEDLVSPKTLRGLFATPQALATRLNEIKLAILTRQDAELRSVGKDGVIVRDKADFAKIPEGGRYYDEDGNLRIK